MSDLAGQVAALEADAKKAIGHADWLRKKYEDCRADLAVAESRLASARVEGAREALTRLYDRIRWSDTPSLANAAESLKRQLCEFRDQEYPAPAAPRSDPSSGQRDKLRAAALALYEKDMWVCEGVPEEEQVRLWENLRDALGLPAGHATELGVGAAPAAPAGEPTLYAACPKCGEQVPCEYDCRPAPTPESGVLEFEMWGTTRNEWVRVTLSPADCRRIVALGSRPTTEGQ